MKTKVLVVDDSVSIRDFVSKNLAARDYDVFTSGNGLEALAIFDTQSIDLIILDIMMPQLDGFETARRIRAFSRVPIIVLTAMGAESDKVNAFNIGVDDYLTKPFGVGELLGRVNAVLRRSKWNDHEPSTEKLIRGDISVDLIRHEVSVAGRMVDLTPIEFSLLVYLMNNAGKMLTHMDILHNVWGPEYGYEVEYLRVYIGHLRQAIEKYPLKPEYILTKRGIGYIFDK